MTILEFTLSLIIYLIIGLWICWKRDWYPDLEYGGKEPMSIIFALIFMPINLIIVLLKEFVIREWGND